MAALCHLAVPMKTMARDVIAGMKKGDRGGRLVTVRSAGWSSADQGIERDLRTRQAAKLRH